MLTVSLPFPSLVARDKAAASGSNKQRGFFQTSAPQIDYSHLDVSALQGIDSDCIELITLLLQKDPALRPTIKQILTHPFLTPLAEVKEG